VLDILHNLIGEAQDLVTAGVVLMAIVMVVSTWAKTRAFVPTLGAILFGALVIWGVNNVDFLEEQMGETVEELDEEGGAPLNDAPAVDAPVLVGAAVGTGA
jgi:hypothetical protein